MSTQSPMYSVLVSGASGQVGQSLRHVLDTEETPLFSKNSWGFLDRSSLDLSQTDNLSSVIEGLLDKHAPKAFVHAAAFTAVDAAETQKEAAFTINETATRILAAACAKRNILFVYLSTDFVFAGKSTDQKPFLPSDPIHPIGVYAQSKAAGEKAVQLHGGPHYIVRTSWVFSPFGNNFVKTMLRLAKERLQFSSEPNQQTSARVKPTISVVSDQFGCPTSALDLARALLALLTVQSLPYGILHFSNAGPVHWAQLAGAVFEQSNLPITVKPISSEDFAAAAPRPAYSVLENTLDPKARHWKEALAEVLSILNTA